jgi:hypothetical protein
VAGIDRRAILTRIHEPTEAAMAREFIRESRRQILRIIVVALAVGGLPGRGMAGADEPEKAKDVSEQIVDTMNAIRRRRDREPMSKPWGRHDNHIQPIPKLLMSS